MPKLLSGSILRDGGSGEFITLSGAQPALGPTDSTLTGFTLVTSPTGITSYSNILGRLTFENGNIFSEVLDQNITIRTTGTGLLQIESPTLFNNRVEFGNTLTFIDVTANGIIRFTAGVPSDSYTSGTLIVTGGAGISEDLFVNQNLDVGGTFDARGTINLNPIGNNVTIQPSAGGTVIINPDVLGNIDNIVIGQTIPAQARFTNTEISGQLTVTSTESSNSTQTGAVIISGGLGVAENVYAQAIYDTDLRVINQIEIGKGLGGTGLGPTAFLTNTGVTSIIAGTGTFIDSSTGDVTIWTFGNTLQDVTEQGNTTDKIVIFENTTNATTGTTGSVVILGGLGVVKDLWVDGNINTKVFNATQTIFSNTEITSLAVNTSSLSQNALYVRGGVGIGNDLAVGRDAIIYGDLVVFGTQTIVSSSVADVGRKVIALSTSGGPAILAVDSGITVGPTSSPFVKWFFDGSSSWKSAGNVIPDADDTYTLGNIARQWANIYTEKITIVGTEQSSNTQTGALLVAGGVGISKNLNINGLFRSTDQTNAFALNEGAWSIVGGASITKNLIVGGQVNLLNTTNSTGTQSGALVIKGGIGVGGDVYARNFYDAAGGKFITTTTLGQTQVVSIFAGEDIAVSTATGFVTISNTSTFQSVTNRGNSTTNEIIITNTNDVISSGTGALQISGGVYIDKSLIIANTLTVYGKTLLAGTFTAITESFLNLHQPLEETWSYNDNKDIGILYHFNNGPADLGFLGRKNTSGYLEWYGTNVETADGQLITGTFGTFKTADIHLVGQIASIDRFSGTLIVDGGVGVSGAIYAGSLYSDNSPVLTEANFSSFGVSAITAGTDTAVSTSTGNVTIWNTSTLDTVTLRGATTTNAIYVANTLTTDNLVVNNTLTSNHIIATSTEITQLIAYELTSTIATIGGLTAVNVDITGSLEVTANINKPISVINDIDNTSTFYIKNQSSGTQAASGYTIENDLNQKIELILNSSNRSSGIHDTGTGYLFLSDDISTFSLGNNSQLDFYTQNIASGIPPTLSLSTTGTANITSNLKILSNPLDATPKTTLELISGAVSGLSNLTLKNTSFNGQSYTIEVGGNNQSSGNGTNINEGNLTIKDNIADQYRLVIKKVSGNVIVGGEFDDEENLFQVNGSARIADSFTATTATAVALTVNSTAIIGSSLLETSITNINTTDPVSIDRFDANTYRSAKCLVQVTENDTFQLTEIVLLHDGVGNVYKSEYGIITTHSVLGMFSSAISGTDVVLYFEAIDSTSKSVNVVRTTLKI